MRKNYLGVGFVFALLLVICQISLIAGPVPITTDGLVITQGDKQFSNFTCVINAEGATTPGACGAISVVGETLGGLNGLLFNGNFSAQTFPGVIDLSSIDVAVTYDVTVLDPNFQISDIHLQFDAVATGLANASITETVLDGLTAIGAATVSVPPNCPAVNCSATVNLAYPVSSATVRKDMRLDAFTSGTLSGDVSFSFVDQLLSQTGVPEPFSILLFGTVLVGCGVITRRKVVRQ